MRCVLNIANVHRKGGGLNSASIAYLTTLMPGFNETHMQSQHEKQSGYIQKGEYRNLCLDQG